MDDAILTTERLLLRHQRKSDIKFLVELWMDEEVTRFSGGPRDKAMLVEEFRRVAEQPRELEFDLWPLELRKGHELVGHAGLIPKEIQGKHCVELCFYLDKTRWGKGYAKEIGRALVAYAFGAKGLDQLVAVIDPANEASKAVAKAIGMSYWLNEERSGKTKSVYRVRRPSVG